VLMRESPWTGFPGGIGYVYYPGMVPEVPGDGEVSYVLQWLDKSEVWSAPDASLWSKRLTSGGLSTSTYRSLLDGPVGPFDVEYGRRLNCYQQPCGADAPWGQAHEVAESTLVQRGDWHNHPAWAWSRHYDPGPTYNDSAHYPYLWLLSRSDPSVYVGNMFWDPSAAPADNVDHSTTSVGLEPTLGTEESWEMLYPEVVWDFGSHEALPATRAGVASLAQLAVVDTSWGYQGGRAQVAQIQTTGPVVLSMPDRALTSPVYRQAVIRYRATGNATPSLVWSDAAGEHGAPFAVRSQPGGWKVGVLDLTRLGTWSHLTSVTAIGLALDQASGQQAVIDVDFLIVAP